MVPCVIFEDEHLLVVNKPAGWNTHAPSPYAGEGIYDWLRHREPRWSTLAILHRLDKETSGVLVFGKTPAANRSLTDQFTDRHVRKKYVLQTDRPGPTGELMVKTALVRLGEKYVSRPVHAGAEIAETIFRPLAAGLVEAEPLTGRTHQIRVHAAASGFPILGDTLYEGTPADRVYLHAAEIAFNHPATGEPATFRAPADFAVPLEQISKLEIPPNKLPDHLPSPPGACLPTILPLPPGEGHGEGRPEPTSLSPRIQPPSLTRLSLRTAFIDPALTDAFRLIHGATDGWPGWYVEKLGDYILSQSEQPLDPHRVAELNKLAKEFSTHGVYHKTLTRQVRRTTTAETSPQLVLGDPAPERFTIQENGLRFELSFTEGYSVGLFLDQRDNRRRLVTGHIAAAFPPLPSAPGGNSWEILNVFAYTCGFSVGAARAGAKTTSLDLSKKYLEWGRRNFTLNDLDPAAHDFIYGDAFDWLRRLAKKGRAYDVIVLDPPTFSQSKEHGTFRADKDYGQLVATALPVLKPGGILLASANTADWPPEEFLADIEKAVHATGRRIQHRHYAPQPPDFPISRDEPAYLKTVWLKIP